MASDMTETNVWESDPGKPGPGNRGTEAPQPSDSKRFKQEINPSQQSESGASAASSIDGSLRTRSPQHVASGILTKTATSAAATASILKAQKTKPPKEKKDGCCLKSSSTSSQNLHDQASSGSSNTPPTRSPKSSIFTRFLHRQSHGAADGDGQKNSKGSKSDGQQSKSPKSPKSRLSDGRLKLFNRTSSIKEVKIALPASGKSTVAKSSGQHGASRSALRQPTIREKTSSKTKDASRSKISFSLGSQQSHEKLTTDTSPEPSATQRSLSTNGTVNKKVNSNGFPAVSPIRDAARGVHGHIEAMDTSNTKDEVPKCRRESVQAWVNSISDERLDGVEDMEQQDAAASGSGVTMEVTHHDPTGAGHGVKADDDDLTLGAEAKLLTPGKDVTLSRSTKHRLAEVGASSGRNRQSAWREMFSSIKTESFNSEGSAHTARTWDSIEQLLQERTGDPVEILTNLGFHSQESDESLPSRIPDRFLRQQSVASGISVEKFIESNPDLKEYVALTRSLSEPSTASLASGEKERRPSTRKPSTAGGIKSFASLVKKLTFMQRIAARMSWKEIDMTRKFLTPVDSATARHQSVRYSGVAPSGKSFTSILHPDNSQHLAEQGVYDEVNSRRASEVDGVARANTRVPPSLDLSKIPGRFSPVPPAQDAKDTIPSPVPSPIASGQSLQNVGLDRVPARFSSSTPPRESVITPPPPELLTPPMTNEKRGSLSVPGEPRSRSASLWKRLSDAGRELEQIKTEEKVKAQPRNMIDVSQPGRCPDLPLRFLIHSPESIINTSFHRSLDVEDKETISTNSQKVGDEGKVVQKKQESTEQEESSKEVVKRPSVQVLLRQPTEEEETLGEAKMEESVNEYEAHRPTKLQKRRSDSLETTNITENIDPVESEIKDGPSKKVRRKLGSMCNVTDQAKLLRSLDIETLNTPTFETESKQNEECTDGDSNMFDFNDNSLHQRLSVASCGLADDEDDDESNKSLTRKREKASKFLRKFLSQQEDEKAEDSDSDGSVGDPAEPVEFGTAVMVKVLANRVLHKWRKPQIAPTEEPPPEEQTTTDQGSVSGDDVGNIYGEGMDVDHDEAVPDSSAIGGAKSPIKDNLSDTDMVDPDMSDVNDPELVRSDDTDTLSSVSHRSEHVTFDCESISCLPPNVIMQESNETPRRRITVCNATIQLELKKQEIDLALKGPRTSDSGIDYESLLAVKRRRFSRQDNVLPQDSLTNKNVTPSSEANSETNENYCQDIHAKNANNEFDYIDNAVRNPTKTCEMLSTQDKSPVLDSGVRDENYNSTIALNTASYIIISDVHHEQSASENLLSDMASDDKEETALLLPSDRLDLSIKDSDYSVSPLQSECSVVLSDLDIGLKNRFLHRTGNLGTEHEISEDHHIVDEVDKTLEEKIICVSDIDNSDKMIGVQQNDDTLLSMDLPSPETMKEVKTTIQSGHTESEKGKENQEIQQPETFSLLDSTVGDSFDDICENCETGKEYMSAIQSGYIESEETIDTQELQRPNSFALPEFTVGASSNVICITDEIFDRDVSVIQGNQNVCEKAKDNQEVLSPDRLALPGFTVEASLEDICKTDETVGTVPVLQSNQNMYEKAKDNQAVQSPDNHGLTEFISEGAPADIGTSYEINKEDIPVIHSSQDGSVKANFNKQVKSPESLGPLELRVIGKSDNSCESEIPQLSFYQQEQSLIVQGEEVVKAHTEETLHTTNVGDEDIILPKVSHLIESFEKDPDSASVNMDTNHFLEIVPMIKENYACIIAPDVEIDTNSGDEVAQDIVCVPENPINGEKESSNSCGSLVTETFIEDLLLSNVGINECIREDSIVCESTPRLEMVLVTKDQEVPHEGTSDTVTEVQNDGSLTVQLKEPLIVSLGEDQSASSCSSDHGISEDLLLVANQARKMSFLRYTESDRDDSIRSETQDTECIFQEQLIDDNVLDRSLSEQSYLVDLLDQLKQNKSIQSIKRSSSVGSIEHRLSSVFQPVELAQPAQKERLNETRKEDVTAIDHVNLPHTGKDNVKVIRSDPAFEASCVSSIPNQQSFDLEEVSSEDFVGNSLPKVTKAGGPASQQPFLRAFSAQSDSSGFVEMEGTEIDWRELKILGLGSSADSESSSRRSSHGAPVRKRSLRWDRQPLTMGTTAGKPLPDSDENKDATKSDDTADDAEENLWSIVENGHTITQKDFLFGVPQRMKEKEASSRPRTRRRSRKQRPPPPPQWTSRLYIDPPTSPKVIPSSKMEVKFTIDKGQIQDIENAQVVPVSPSKTAGNGQRAVSYLCLSVSQDKGNFEITPVDKGNFSLPSLDMSKMDVSQHQVICSLLRRSSTAWKPDEETLRQFTLWNSTDATERRERTMHLIEEVKLIQHAITKFKIEFRVLDLRTNSIYNQHPETVTPQQRAELVDLSNLRSQIMQEITELERRLGERMRMILGAESGMYTGDLSNLQVVQEVVEVLKEQVYHSSLIHGMSLPGPSHDKQLESSTGEQDLVRQLSALQGHIEEHQNKTTTQLTSTMDQMRQALLAEVRESVQKETEDLRKQVLDSQTEVRNLKDQLQVYTDAPARASSSPDKTTEVRFPITASPIGQLSVNASEVDSGQSNGGTGAVDQLELQVSQSHRHEESPIERSFRPISKQDSDELEQI